MGIELKIATEVDEQRADFLVTMINEVYELSEGNIWIDDYDRISKGLLLNCIRNKELLLAIKDDEVYGCIHLEQVDDATCKFKMLVANPKFKGTGVGSLLVDFAEQQAKSYGAATMHLELLVPTEFIHEDKVFLHDWYTRIGYRKIAEHDVDYVHQGISDFLKVGCVAKIYAKTLSDL